MGGWTCNYGVRPWLGPMSWRRTPFPGHCRPPARPPPGAPTRVSPDKAAPPNSVCSWRGWRSGGLGTRPPKTGPTRSLRPPELGIENRADLPHAEAEGRIDTTHAPGSHALMLAQRHPQSPEHGHFPGAHGALKQVGSVVRGPKVN